MPAADGFGDYKGDGGKKLDAREGGGGWRGGGKCVGIDLSKTRCFDLAIGALYQSPAGPGRVE